jgi:uncharacterized repeat protein (TIGR03803 family)
MNTRNTSRISLVAIAIAAVTFSLAVCAQAQTETILHSFQQTTDGGDPSAGLLLDSSGNLYGTTQFGGNTHFCNVGCGVAYRLSKLSTGRWQETVLRDFTGTGGSSGSLVSDAAGNLYGTTQFGGKRTACPASGFPGCGTVFELSPTSSGAWTRTLLYAFTGGADGGVPTSNLIFDAAGNLYGTAVYGGNLSACTDGCGVVFKLSPSSSGTWTETVLYSFSGSDGGGPRGSVIFDSAGNLYGTTPYNSTGAGTVYELSPTSSGPWSLTTLYVFQDSTDGGTPFEGLLMDASGNLFGTTYGGGNLADCNKVGCGTVFELSPIAGGGWSFNAIYAFNGTDGKTPFAPLAPDSAGNLYGTTLFGGAHNQGVLFELSPISSGGWTEKTVHSFGSTPSDGKNPSSGVILDSAGTIYGTTQNGGKYGFGSVYKIEP